MRSKPVYIAGAGVASPFGDNFESVWRALISPPELRRYSLYAGGRQRPVLAHIADALRYEADAEEYFVALCRRALQGLLAQCSIDFGKRGCFLLGTGMGASDFYLSGGQPGTHWEQSLLRRVTRGMLEDLPAEWTANACCAGAQAVAYGCDLVRLGEMDYVIAGGAEAFSYLTWAGFERLGAIDPRGCKPFDHRRRGISVGEGAAFFLLCAHRPPDPLACLLGYGATSDAYHMVAPAPGGDAMRRAMEQALRRSGLHPRLIDAVIAHGTGTIRNDAAEGGVLHGLLGKTRVTAPKGALGHTGGASGPFSLLTAIGCLRYQTLPAIARTVRPDQALKVRPATRTVSMRLRYLLVNCFAFGGSNLSMVCAAPEQAAYGGLEAARRPPSERQIGHVPAGIRRSSFSLPWPDLPTPPAGAAGRTMDPLCMRILTLAEALLNTGWDWNGRYDVGAVLSVEGGMKYTLSQCAEILRTGEPRQLNPSRFPYVMLSTALSCLTQRLGLHGPSSVFVERKSDGAMRYARTLIRSQQCAAVLCVCLREGRFLRADILEREEKPEKGDGNEGCAH